MNCSLKIAVLSVGALSIVAPAYANPSLSGGYVAPVVEVEPVIAEPQLWDGAYIGGTLGYAFGGDDKVGIGQGQVTTLTTPGSLDIGGANYGLRLGFRNQIERERRDWVVGAEISYEMGKIDDEFAAGGYKASTEVNNMLALRLKNGILNKDQSTLYYGIIGVGRLDYDYAVNGTGAGGSIALNKEGVTSTGYILGLGVERKLSEHLSLTGEWEYASFKKEHLEDAKGKSTEVTPKFHNIKLGLNYQF